MSKKQSQNLPATNGSSRRLQEIHSPGAHSLHGEMGSENPPGNVATLIHPLSGSLFPWGECGTSPAGPQRVQGLWQLLLPVLLWLEWKLHKGKTHLYRKYHRAFNQGFFACLWNRSHLENVLERWSIHTKDGALTARLSEVNSPAKSPSGNEILSQIFKRLFCFN